MASGGSSNGGGSVWGAGGATAAERLKAQAQAAAPAAAGAGGNGGAQAAAAGGFMKARLAYLLTNLVGETVELTTSDGSKYRGVFSASNVGDADELAVALRVVTTLVDGATGAAPAPHRPATQLVVKGENVVRLEAKGVRLRDDSVVDASEDDAGLGTDAGIARRSKAGEYGRELQAWDGGDVPEDLTLEATFGDEKGGRG